MVRSAQGLGRNFPRPGSRRSGHVLSRSLAGTGVRSRRDDRLVAIESKPTRFEFFGAAGKLLTGPRKEDWRRIDTRARRAARRRLFVDPKGQIIVVSLTGIFRFEGTGTHEHHPLKVLGFDLAPHDGSDHFIRMTVTPEQKWHRPFAAAMNRADGSLAIFSHGIARTRAAPMETSKYTVRGEIDLADRKREPS